MRNSGLRDLEFKTNLVYTGELVSTKKSRRFLQQIETIMEAHNWSKYRAYTTPGYPSLKWNISNTAPPSRHQEHEGDGNILRAEDQEACYNNIFWA